MTVVCWSVKGGSGATVVSAVLALLAAQQADTIAVDLAGDLGPALGLPDPGGPGLLDWLAADPRPAPGALAALGQSAGERLTVIPPGPLARQVGVGLAAVDTVRLAQGLGELTGRVIVDAGSAGPIPGLAAPDVSSLLVLRPCFLALRRAATVPSEWITGVVMVDEPGRALDRRDIESTLRRPVLAVVPHDPAVARAVDAGLLLGRLPATVARSLRAVA